MNERPTPECDKQTFDPYPWNNNGPGRSHRPEGNKHDGSKCFIEYEDTLNIVEWRKES